MRWKHSTCPTCGEPPAFLAESVAVQARLTPSLTEPGTFDYAGDSRVCWDAQHPVIDTQGTQNLWCAQGHDWWTRPADSETAETPARQATPAAEATPMLVSWQWAENGTGLFIEQVLMTPSQHEDLERRLAILEVQGDICDVYIGPEQVTPTAYEEFRSRYAFLEDRFLTPEAGTPASSPVPAAF